MDFHGSSSSGDMFDSQGFQDFLNAQDSSEEDLLMKKAEKKPNPTRPSTGDPYAFDIDFGNIKIPSAQPKKPKTAEGKKGLLKESKNTTDQPPIKKAVTFDDKKQDSFEAPQAPSKFQHYLDALKNPSVEDSESEPPSSDKDAPSLKVVNWSDFKDSVLDEEDLKELTESPTEIKTEPFKLGIKPPISLNKKLETSKTDLHAEEFDIPDSTVRSGENKSEESYNETDDYFESLSSEFKSLEKSQELKDQEIEEKPYEVEEVKQNSQEIKVSENYSLEKPTQSDTKEVTGDSKPFEARNEVTENYSFGKPTQLDTKKATSDTFETRKTEIANIDLNKQVRDLKNQLEVKQEKIFELEKQNTELKAHKAEGEAVDKIRAQLRESNHKIELYKIETEELIKQLDYSEARVKDLEAENTKLKEELERRAKLLEERIRLSESAAEERAVRSTTRKFEMEKEEAERLCKQYEIELRKTQQELRATDQEKLELRKKLQEKYDESQKVQELEHQIYLLKNQGSATQKIEENQNKDIQKEMEVQETLIRGYQKENEKLVEEARKLRAQTKQEQLRIHEENKKLEHLRAALVKEHGGILIKENVSDLSSINELAGGTVVSKEEYLNLKERAKQLHNQLLEKEKLLSEKEQNFNEQLTAFTKYREEAEYFKQVSSVPSNEEINKLKSEYEAKINSLQSELQEHKNQVQNLNQQIEKVRRESSDIAQFEAKRLKEKESDCKQLEQQLKQLSEEKSSGTKAESEQIGFLHKRIAELEREVQEKEVYYESKIRNLKENISPATFTYKEAPKQPPKEAWTDNFSENRIKELEEELRKLRTKESNQKSTALKYQSLQDEYDELYSKTQYLENECQKLKIDKQRLELHIQKTPVAPGASEFLALQKKIESLEASHYRREEELKQRLSSAQHTSDKDIYELQKKHQEEKTRLQQKIRSKNNQIKEFREELNQLLNQIEILSKRK